MKIRKGLTAYLNEQMKEISLNLPKVIGSLDADAIHDLRVAVKKIKSIFETIDFCHPESQLIDEHFSAFHEMFKALGKVRDRQIQLELIEQYEGDMTLAMAGLKENLEEKIKRYCQDALKACENFSGEGMKEDKKEVKRLLESISEELFLIRAMKYVKKLLQPIDLPKEERKQNKKIHKSRTYIKKAYYVMDLLQEYTDFNELQPLIDQAKSMGSKIGAWHDQVVLLEKTEKYIRKKQGVTEPYKKLKHTLEEEIEDFRKVYKKDAKRLLKDLKSFL